MKLNAKVTLILFVTIVVACEKVYLPAEPVFEREAICAKHADSITWLLENDERQFVLALDKNNTLAGGC